jgi:hypothetical protein
MFKELSQGPMLFCDPGTIEKGPKKALPNLLQHVLDDVGRVTFDAETVARLATGQPLPLEAGAVSNHHPASNR